MTFITEVVRTALFITDNLKAYTSWDLLETGLIWEQKIEKGRLG